MTDIYNILLHIV